ncbi:hypothetical protein P152DRAFT_500437 [Eremomyces bilateralis CBS 781.70]|uniref:Uncharacterized protein n=1 Tax=Eremomyces bilateralis CBS 781.70 TaxID=1392243 RepID=A0A6G1G961_9PEZI|nr:uncharacterized protein P152DRAFT_500437 [Eremomyces bilateralis CBS 781.70]KAF1814553.1 hypothetical protein P152DRAFT_500437 [Eremomyces bilateralis CBS 781.70]
MASARIHLFLFSRDGNNNIVIAIAIIICTMATLFLLVLSPLSCTEHACAVTARWQAMAETGPVLPFRTIGLLKVGLRGASRKRAQCSDFPLAAIYRIFPITLWDSLRWAHIPHGRQVQANRMATRLVGPGNILRHRSLSKPEGTPPPQNSTRGAQKLTRCELLSDKSRDEGGYDSDAEIIMSSDVVNRVSTPSNPVTIRHVQADFQGEVRDCGDISPFVVPVLITQLCSTDHGTSGAPITLEGEWEASTARETVSPAEIASHDNGHDQTSMFGAHLCENRNGPTVSFQGIELEEPIAVLDGKVGGSRTVEPAEYPYSTVEDSSPPAQGAGSPARSHLLQHMRISNLLRSTSRASSASVAVGPSYGLCRTKSGFSIVSRPSTSRHLKTGLSRSGSGIRIDSPKPDDLLSVSSSRPTTPLQRSSQMMKDEDIPPVPDIPPLMAKALETPNHDVTTPSPNTIYQSAFEERPHNWMGLGDCNSADSSTARRDSGIDSIQPDWDPPDVICYKANPKNKRDSVVGYLQTVTKKKIRSGEFLYHDGANDDPMTLNSGRRPSVLERSEAVDMWRKAVQANENEKSTLFLPQNQGKTSPYAPRERSSSLLNRVPSRSASTLPTHENRSSFGVRESPSVSGVPSFKIDSFLSPRSAENAVDTPSARSLSLSPLQQTPEHEAMKRFPSLQPLYQLGGLAHNDDISRSRTSCGYVPVIKVSGIDPATLGVWAQYPSHTREERTGSAGLADNVIVRDFAVEQSTPRKSGPIFRPSSTPRLWLRRQRRGIGLPKSRSIDFSKSIFKKYARIFSPQSDEFRHQGHGHRSSVSARGALRYPDLELLPPVFPDSTSSAVDRVRSTAHSPGTAIPIPDIRFEKAVVDSKMDGKSGADTLDLSPAQSLPAPPQANVASPHNLSLRQASVLDLPSQVDGCPDRVLSPRSAAAWALIYQQSLPITEQVFASRDSSTGNARLSDFDFGFKSAAPSAYELAPSHP